MAYDASLSRAVLRAFVGAVAAYYRRHAREAGLGGRAHTGAVTIVQRFAQTLALDPHYHSLVPDGVWVVGKDGAPGFFAFAAPGADEVAAVAADVARRVQRLCARRGQPLDASGGEPADDALTEREAALAAMAGASVQGLIATGRRRGCRVMRMGQTPDAPLAFVKAGLCADVAGFDVHAGVRVAASDRAGLERLCRYLARPPLASDRLSQPGDGRIALALRKPLRDGATHLVFEPHELLEKLSALVPAPWSHQTLFHGVFASAAKLRPAIVPAPAEAAALAATPGQPAGAPSDATATTTTPAPDHQDSPASRKRRIAWASLLARVFD
ncbi:MAG: transposase, partial [Myxococcota bacterium]